MAKTDSSDILEAKKMREAWATGDAIRDKGYTRAKVREINDIPYVESKEECEEQYHLTDIYYPMDKEMEKYPLIVSIHGGGWFYGDKELYSLYTTYLATFGFAVVNFNYRLSPVYKYPSGFEDVCALMSFLAKNSEKYKLDMERVYILGDSAGAQLTNQYAIWANSEEYRKLFDFSDKYEPLRIAKIALNCGVYDFNTMLEDDAIYRKWYFDPDMSDDLKKSMFDYLKYINKAYPDTYLMLSVNDALAPRTTPLKEILEKNGTKVVYREFGQDNKDDGHVFHLNMGSKNGMICNKEEIEFFEGKLS